MILASFGFSVCSTSVRSARVIIMPDSLRLASWRRKRLLSFSFTRDRDSRRVSFFSSAAASSTRMGKKPMSRRRAMAARWFSASMTPLLTAPGPFFTS